MAASQQKASQMPNGFLDRFFGLTERGTSVRTEILAGLTTFVTMAYIIIVNPLTLTLADLPEEIRSGLSLPSWGGVFMATIVAAALSTLVMGLFANWPIALAPGMGLNAFFAFTLVLGQGLPWQTALGAVAISGVLSLIVTTTGLRELMIKAIPASLRAAVGAGIGFFIMLIGLKNAGIVVPLEATIITLGNLGDRGVMLAILGLIITAALVARKVTGGILIGIIATTLIGIPMGVTTPPTEIIAKPLPMDGFLAFDIMSALKFSLLPVIFSLFFTDLFDTIGTFMGVAGKAGLMDKEGNFKGGRRALFADGLGTVIGAAFGTSNTTSYVESASGISAGGRTGLTAVVTAACFMLSIFLWPLFLAVPGQATAPALIIVGVLMSSAILQVDLDDFSEAFPAVITALLMPFTFSISHGLAIGFVSYVLINLFMGRFAKVHWMMFVLSAFFIYYFAIH